MRNFDKSRLTFVLVMIVLLFTSFILDEFISTFLSPMGIRFFIVQTLFFTFSLSVSFPIMLIFAFLTGLTWDSIHMAIDMGMDMDMDTHRRPRNDTNWEIVSFFRACVRLFF